MTAVERIAAFLKDRDENVMPDECDDVERMESAKAILRELIGRDGKLNFAEILMCGDSDMMMQLKPAARPAGACRACGSMTTLRGKPLTGKYCSPACREAGPSRPKVDIEVLS